MKVHKRDWHTWIVRCETGKRKYVGPLATIIWHRVTCKRCLAKRKGKR